MKSILSEMSMLVEEFGSAPKIEEMPQRTLLDKGIYGPTAAHVLEQVHTPLNLAYLTFTTGSSAFQNIVGITYAELEERSLASKKALNMAGVYSGDKILFTYPPLVNVFSKQALDEYGLNWTFLKRSSRDAFLVALYEEQPRVVVGESSFLRVAIEDAKAIGVLESLPRELIFLTAGTPLDLELLEVVDKYLPSSKVHDLYGCQEFGWLALNGVLLREDISLVPACGSGQGEYEVLVGGLPMGDCFPVATSGHICDGKGKLITYRRKRSYPEYEVLVRQTILNSQATVERTARTILRIKSRVVKVAPDIVTGAEHTVLELIPAMGSSELCIKICGPEKTAMFDSLLRAQLEYQQSSKADPVWIKRK